MMDYTPGVEQNTRAVWWSGRKTADWLQSTMRALPTSAGRRNFSTSAGVSAGLAEAQL